MRAFPPSTPNPSPLAPHPSPMSWHPCCCCRYCPNCQGGYAPRQWQVDIAGLANGDPPDCVECEALNGTYVLDPAGACRWEYELEEAVCGVHTVRLSVGDLVVPLGWPIVVELLDSSGGLKLACTKYYGDRPACLSLDGELLGALGLPLGSTLCEVANSSVTITAVRPCG